MQRTQDDRADGRTNSLREEEKAAATTVPPLSLPRRRRSTENRIAPLLLRHLERRSEKSWKRRKDGVIVRRSGRGLLRCGERKLRDDGAVGRQIHILPSEALQVATKCVVVVAAWEKSKEAPQQKEGTSYRTRAAKSAAAAVRTTDDNKTRSEER